MATLIDNHLNQWVADKAENTLRQWDTHLQEWQEWLADERDKAIDDADWRDIDAYFKAMKGDYAPNTIKSRYGSVRRFYSELERRGHYEESPFEELRPSDYTENGDRKYAGDDGSEPVDPEQLETMCEHVPEPQFRNEVLLRFLFDTGLRESEVVGLQIDDLDLDNRKATVWSPKTKEERTVFYSREVKFLLEKWIDKYRNAFVTARESPYVFNSRKKGENNGRLRPENVGRMVKVAADRAGIQEEMYVDAAGNPRHAITAHSLRSGFAVRALKSGVDLRSVQKQLGHSDIETTMKYLKYTDDDVKNQLDSRLW